VNQPHIHTFSHHYRQKYGEPIGKIAVDIGLPCPNREKGGCIFCGSAGFTPGYLRAADDLKVQLTRGKASLLKGRFRKYFTYFQQETTTALETDKLLPLCDLALSDSDCVGLIISTRPDYIEDDFLMELSALLHLKEKECLFELGVQSAHKKSLKFLNRNHSFYDFTDAVKRISRYELFETGAHLILGIPGESEEEMAATVQAVCSAGIMAVKFHHLQVIRGTPLHDMYRSGKISLFSLEGYMYLLLKILPLVPAEIAIHRLCATSHPDMLTAPKWNILAAVFSKRLLREMKEKGIFQGEKL